ncbi:MAG: hypothetical protein ACFFC7_16140 [Candidatus Hermodarchaeota archaeon]
MVKIIEVRWCIECPYCRPNKDVDGSNIGYCFERSQNTVKTIREKELFDFPEWCPLEEK